MVDLVEQVLEHADVLVIGNRGEEFAGLAEHLRPDQLVIDFVRIRQIEERHANYAGICWYDARSHHRREPAVPFDRRVWQEATALSANGYQVSIICPKARGYETRYECLDGIHIYRHPLPLEAKGALGLRAGVRLVALLGVRALAEGAAGATASM